MASSFSRYVDQRDVPGADHTSRLSPYLHFGELSVEHLWHTLAQPDFAAEQRSAELLRSELGWREFAHYVLFHLPRSSDEPLDSDLASIDWRDDRADLRAWQRGRTGYPLIDAGMRQLWQTGWMHNRVRMAVASFLVKDLLMPWQIGARWFWDTLVDADLANNTLGWQWSAGCGFDAAPFTHASIRPCKPNDSIPRATISGATFPSSRTLQRRTFTARLRRRRSCSPTRASGWVGRTRTRLSTTLPLGDGPWLPSPPAEPSDARHLPQ